MKYFYLSVMSFFIVQGNSYGFSFTKPKAVKEIDIGSSTMPGAKVYEQAISDALYENFENDLQGEFGDGLSIEEEIENQQVNAVSIAIIENNKIKQHHQYGYRDKAKTLKANNKTSFHVASMSKFLAGIAMAEAERQGLLDRDKSIKRYSNQFPDSTLEKWVRKSLKTLRRITQKVLT